MSALELSAGGALSGRRIVITRPEESAISLADKLARLGAAVIRYPVIAYAPPADPSTLNAALARLAAGQYGWLILTSAQTVRQIASGTQLPPGVRIAVVGPATRAECERRLGIIADLMPGLDDNYNGASLADALGALDGQRILLPTSDIAPPTLKRRLEDAGAQVEQIAAYRTIPAPRDPDRHAALLDQFARHAIDAVTFTSASTVHHFAPHFPTLQLATSGAACVCIGPATAKAAGEAGLPRIVVAQSSSDEGMIQALIMVRPI